MPDPLTERERIELAIRLRQKCLSLSFTSGPCADEPKCIICQAADALAGRGVSAPPEGALYGAEVLCPDCASVFCPHGERLHFHHDGCPACCETSAASRRSDP